MHWNLKWCYWQVRRIPRMLRVHKSESGVWMWSTKGIAFLTYLERKSPLHLVYGAKCIQIWKSDIDKYGVFLVCHEYTNQWVKFDIGQQREVRLKHNWNTKDFRTQSTGAKCFEIWNGDIGRYGGFLVSYQCTSLWVELDFGQQREHTSVTCMPWVYYRRKKFLYLGFKSLLSLKYSFCK